MKGKVYKTSNVVWLRDSGTDKDRKLKLDVSELKILRFYLGYTTMDGIRNDPIGGTAKVRCFGDRVKVVRLGWFGHVAKGQQFYW